MNMKALFLAACAASAFVAAATTYYDASGLRQWSVDTDRNGKTTWRDERGRVQGAATTDHSGKTTYRDARGRI